MKNFFLRIGINAVALWAAAAFLSGMHLSNDIGSVLLVALLFGLINALVRPIVALLTCPFYILTLGLFKFVVNAFMLLTAGVLAGDYLRFDSFGWALGASVIISIVTTALSIVLFEEPKTS